MRTGFCTARGAGLSGLKKLGGACAVLVGALSLVSVATPAHAVPINVTYTDSADEGFNDPSLGVLRRRSFEAAAAVWSRRLAGSVPINVSASFDPLGGDARSATLGSAGPSGLFPDWSGGTPPPAANTFYVSALANNLAGRDLDGAEADIEARFNSDLDGPNVFGSSGFYYGLDGNPPAGDVDFFPVVLHELGHGLGFTGLFRQDGTTSAGAFASFDRFLANGPSAGAALLPDFGNAADRAQLLRSNNLFFAGPRARAAYGSSPRVYAPLEYDPGSSTYHTDEASFSGAEELMTPFSTGAPRDAGPVTYAMFLDLGWGSVAGSPGPTPTPTTAAPTPMPANRPANDDFGAAQNIGGATGRVTGSSFNGTKQGGEPNHALNAGGASIWYRWVAPATGRATFETTGSSFDTLLAVYTGSSVDALTLVAQNDDIEVNVNRASRITFDVVAGRTYFFAVDGYRTGGTFESGSVVLVWTATAAPSPTPTAAPVPTATPVPTLPPVVRPANDLFERAQVLSGVAARVGGTTLNATTQVGEPRHAGVGAGRSVWYRWTAPRTGRWTFTTQGSNLDTALALYSGASVNALRLLAADDDDLPLRTSSVSFVLGANVSVYIAVDAKGAGSGPFVLSLAAAPVNDEANAAQVLVGTAGSFRGTTAFASRQVGEPAHANFVGNRSVWFRWAAPVNGIATFRTTGSAFDTLLAVYTGVPLIGLRRVAFGDNDPGALTGTATFTATAGTVYLIAIDGKNAAAGAYALSWSLRLASANDIFSRAQVVSGVTGAVSGTNAIAFAEAGEPRHAGVGAGRSVWYRWVAPQTGRATVAISSPTFRPATAVYEGVAVSALRVQSTVATTNASTMTVGFNAVAGRTYWIAADSYNIGATTIGGPFTLRWTIAPSVPTVRLFERPPFTRLAAWVP